MYGIPNMKLPKEIVSRRIKLMEEEGVTFRLNTEADPETLEKFDAVVLCGGARKPRSLNAEHMDAEGVRFAVDFLSETTGKLLAGEDCNLAKGLHVLVIGGGDTGNDCVGTVLRQGCASVTQLEMMPAPPECRMAGNPWPEWPRTLRTDYGQLEAISVQGSDPRIYETTVKRILTDEQNHITGAETVKLRRTAEGKMEPIAGSEQTLECGLMLIAAGFVGCDGKTLETLSLTADGRGRLMPEDASHHLGGKLFSAGDMRTGQSLVVRALADGRVAALEADVFLRRA
jgi:glutamate synthase (NADPH/NADH) small chain